MEVESCPKPIFALGLRHGKSPCFSQVVFLFIVGPDYRLSVLPYVVNKSIVSQRIAH